MEYQQIVKEIAPCGLDCRRCAGYSQGEIKEHSTKLLNLLGNYERLAKIMSDHNPAFSDYQSFKEILTSFSQASCAGCRNDASACPVDCIAKTCHKEKEVDFCFQCKEYPCSGQNNPMLRERWLQKNNRMKEIGVVEFYNEQKRIPRY
ncbi:DUF3795 domain-containing protein [Desulforamulus aeronauticus]|uniref:DUF3795 domain-containing protein n=1 Tax=Desulforamulus aeronauticus DSM 10349 TaxID=1121421 RepID=A0A1M6VYK3_9FIRM|nr:DUF3795 domain-containing protein [Desulforamulus aeronauticus]SHK86416.1 Protein of unknown function [Desulforamulus aeronauticus DSM 10349]